MRADLRRKLEIPRTQVHHQQTHTVWQGHWAWPAYQDGDVLRSLATDDVVATWRWQGPRSSGDDRGRWWVDGGGTVVPFRTHTPGKWDSVVGTGPAVTVQLDHGRFY